MEILKFDLNSLDANLKFLIPLMVVLGIEGMQMTNFAVILRIISQRGFHIAETTILLFAVFMVGHIAMILHIFSQISMLTLMTLHPMIFPVRMKAF